MWIQKKRQFKILLNGLNREMKKKSNDKIGNFGTLLAELPKSIDCLFA